MGVSQSKDLKSYIDTYEVRKKNHGFWWSKDLDLLSFIKEKCRKMMGWAEDRYIKEISRKMMALSQSKDLLMFV